MLQVDYVLFYRQKYFTYIKNEIYNETNNILFLTRKNHNSSFLQLTLKKSVNKMYQVNDSE